MSYQSKRALEYFGIHPQNTPHTFAREGVDNFLLDTLLTLRETLILQHRTPSGGSRYFRVKCTHLSDGHGGEKSAVKRGTAEG